MCTIWFVHNGIGFAAVGLAAVSTGMLGVVIAQQRAATTEAAKALEAVRESTEAAQRTAASTKALVDSLRLPPLREGIGSLLYTCEVLANTAALECSFTNTGKEHAVACFKGILKHKTGLTLESSVLCTGEVKSRDTRLLTARFSPGSVMAMCGHPGTPWLDMDACKLEVVDVDRDALAKMLEKK